ncbi:7585_t:CDS:1, partial [Scutellospora calospora]
FAETIAAKFNNQNTKNKKSPMINQPVTKSSSIAELYKPTNATKKLLVIKPLKTKPSSITKPYTRTRSKCKLTDLATDMLINLDKSD